MHPTVPYFYCRIGIYENIDSPLRLLRRFGKAFDSIFLWKTALNIQCEPARYNEKCCSSKIVPIYSILETMVQFYIEAGQHVDAKIEENGGKKKKDGKRNQEF